MRRRTETRRNLMMPAQLIDFAWVELKTQWIDRRVRVHRREAVFSESDVLIDVRCFPAGRSLFQLRQTCLQIVSDLVRCARKSTWTYALIEIFRDVRQGHSADLFPSADLSRKANRLFDQGSHSALDTMSCLVTRGENWSQAEG